MAFTWALKHPICTFSKVSSLHCYTWVDFWTTDYLIGLHRRQASNHGADTYVRLRSSIAFIWAIERPMWTIFKVHSLHFYAWGKLWTTDYRIGLLRRQASDRQADTWVRFPSSIAFIWAIKCPICTVSKISLFFTLLPLVRFLDHWLSDIVT